MIRAERSISLDLLRAIAIFLVLIRHAEPCPPDYPVALRAAIESFRRGGWIGVDLFFVLSGFLVSGLLFKELKLHGKINVGRFLVRRGLKIYPAFFVFVFVTVLVQFFWYNQFDPKKILVEVLFLQNYFWGLWAHTWSLAVEEHFYLTLPLVLLLLAPTRHLDPVPRVLLLFLLVAGSCWYLRSRIDPSLPFSFRTQLIPTHLRIDSLLAGVVISAFYHYRPRSFTQFPRGARLPLLFLGLAAVAPPFAFVLDETPWLPRAGFTVITLGCSCILVSSLSWEPKNAICRGIASVGAHSYSIYLWHLAVAEWGRDGAEKLAGQPLNWLVDFIGYCFISISFGILMSKAVEWPVLKLRDRWFPSRSQPSPASAGETPRFSGLAAISGSPQTAEDKIVVQNGPPIVS